METSPHPCREVLAFPGLCAARPRLGLPICALRAGDQVTGMSAWPPAGRLMTPRSPPALPPTPRAGSWDLAWGHTHFTQAGGTRREVIKWKVIYSLVSGVKPQARPGAGTFLGGIRP